MKSLIAKNLKKHLRDNDMSVAKLSRATKVPAQTLNNWLADLEPRNIGQVKIVADYFKIGLDELLFDDPPKRNNPLKNHEDEINAGVFEVVLRRVKNKPS
jgi:transcriptional regulator with XRE-family HTH domain